MSDSTESPQGPQIRLVGEWGGRERCHDLRVGTHRLGSSRESDLRLRAEGVSRQHAVLEVTSSGLLVEDRGSTNGTFVNGVRVGRSAVPLGATVRFGTVELTVEGLDPEEMELALDLGAEAADPVSRWSAWSSTMTAYGPLSVPAAWLEMLDGFAARLALGAGEDLGGALTYLVAGLEATGGAIVAWTSEGVPAIRAGCGSLPAVPAAIDLERELRRRDLGKEPLVALRLAGERRRAVAALRLGGELRHALFVDLSPSAEGPVEMMLRVALRMVMVHLPVDSAEAAKPPAAGTLLRFPAAYRRAISVPMEALYRELETLAGSDVSVLVVGETGVGKERLVRILHQSSPRAKKPFVAINCAAIPADLLEAELFGIGRRVATGVEERRGRFEEADGGTLFLDEVAEMPAALQTKLLRALQESEVQPIGGAPRPIDARVVAATNADLESAMSDGRFRRDLYYRLAGYELDVPPLRRCREDIPGLVEHFLHRFSVEERVPLAGVSVKAMRVLIDHAWPGNVRELENEMRRLVLLAGRSGRPRVIESTLLPERLARSVSSIGDPGSQEDGLELEPALERLEGHLIRSALRRARGKQVEAARLLGIHRNGLAKKLKRLGIRPDEVGG